MVSSAVAINFFKCLQGTISGLNMGVICVFSKFNFSRTVGLVTRQVPYLIYFPSQLCRKLLKEIQLLH